MCCLKVLLAVKSKRFVQQLNSFEWNRGADDALDAGYCGKVFDRWGQRELKYLHGSNSGLYNHARLVFRAVMFCIIIVLILFANNLI